MNHAAVRAVSMRSLNRQRANIVLSHLIAHDKVLMPQQVSRRERIFERDGVLRWSDDQILGFCRIGVSLEEFVTRRSISGEGSAGAKLLARLLDLYKDEGYILSFDPTTTTVHIALKRNSSVQIHFKAWCHGLLLAKQMSKLREDNTNIDTDVVFRSIARTLGRTKKVFDEYIQRLRESGWDLDISALETHSGTRLTYRNENDNFHRKEDTKQSLFDAEERNGKGDRAG